MIYFSTSLGRNSCDQDIPEDATPVTGPDGSDQIKVLAWWFSADGDIVQAIDRPQEEAADSRGRQQVVEDDVWTRKGIVLEPRVRP